MYAPVATRFRTYLPDLAAYGDDGAAQAYVEAVFALPAMSNGSGGPGGIARKLRRGNGLTPINLGLKTLLTADPE